MKIVAFSDVHGQYGKKLTNWFDNNPGDLLLFAGDLQANQTSDYGLEFANWFHKLPYTFKILVFGNHDGHYKDTISHIVSMDYDDIVVLMDSHFKFSVKGESVKIYGSPHSVEYGSWWFMKKDNELEKLWSDIPDDTNILITHGPPYGILDTTFLGVHAGSKSLLKRTEELKDLKYHIYGHIHEAYGKRTYMDNGEKIFMNVSLLNEKYQYVNEPMVIDYKG